MEDTFTIIIAIFIGAVVIFIVPLISFADRNDVIAQEDIQTIVDEFVTDVTTTGIITMEKYENFENEILATGNMYDIQIEIQVLDENPSKKTTLAVQTKIGENVYYSYFKTQALEILEELGVIELKEGDIITAKVATISPTLYDSFRSTFLGTANDGTGTIKAQSSGMVIVVGNASDNNNVTGTTQQELIYSITYNKNSTIDDISNMPSNSAKKIRTGL